MRAKRLLGGGRTHGVSFWPFLNSSSWWWLISTMFLTRTSCCKITHTNGYYGAWAGWTISVHVSRNTTAFPLTHSSHHRLLGLALPWPQSFCTQCSLCLDNSAPSIVIAESISSFHFLRTLLKYHPVTYELSYTTQPALPIHLSPSPSEPLYIYLLIDLCLPPLEDMLMRAAFSLSAPFCLPVHHLEQCPTHSRHSINTCWVVVWPFEHKKGVPVHVC